MAQPKPSLKDLMPKDLPEKPDPNFKLTVRETIIGAAFEPPRAKLRTWLDQITIDNSRLIPGSEVYFSYLGELYIHSATSLNPKEYPRVMPRLDRSLREEMTKWLAQSNDLETELDMARSATAAILNAANHVEDYQEMLPDGLRYCLAGIVTPSAYSRLNPTQLIEAKSATAKASNILRQRLLSNLLL